MIGVVFVTVPLPVPAVFSVTSNEALPGSSISTLSSATGTALLKVMLWPVQTTKSFAVFQVSITPVSMSIVAVVLALMLTSVTAPLVEVKVPSLSSSTKVNCVSLCLNASIGAGCVREPITGVAHITSSSPVRVNPSFSLTPTAAGVLTVVAATG
ncbi:MAG: hypothetical protein DELT_03071 [Desulfovibrio sp.]